MSSESGGEASDDAVPEGSRGSPYVADDPSWLAGLHGHHVRYELGDLPDYEYLMVNLGAAQDTTDVSTLRMVRLGGPNDADIEHRQNLFSVVGAIVVAGGHIEAEMKRIVIMGEGLRNASFVDLDLNWTQLELRLESIVSADGPLAAEIEKALSWGRDHKIKKRRDDAVHSAWTLYDVGSAQRARFARKSTGVVQIASLGEAAEAVPYLWEYASRLMTIGIWPTAILPPLKDLPRSGRLPLDWSCGSPTIEPHSGFAVSDSPNDVEGSI